MALSNIFREPRREITESVVGLAIVAAAIAADYAFAQWLQEWAGFYFYKSDPEKILHAYVPWYFGMVIGLGIAVAAVLIVVITHALGDAICNALQDNGIHLRPRQRPGRR